MMTETTTPPSSKKCKVCGESKLLDQFSGNPNSRDGFNSICKDCRGTSTETQRGKKRVQRRRLDWGDVEQQVTDAFELFKLGDPKKDFLIKQLLVIILTPGTNQQSQLRANEMLGQLHGLTKETPKSEEDLIHHALTRLKQQKESQ